MDRNSLAKRCINLETHDLHTDDDKIRHFFPEVLECSLIHAASSLTTLSPDQHWILLFKDENEATSAAEKKRIQVEEGIYWLVHHCTTPCDIPQEWLQKSSFNQRTDEGALASPPTYSEIFPRGNMAMPTLGHAQQPLHYPGAPNQQNPGPSVQQFKGPQYPEHPGGPVPMDPFTGYPMVLLPRAYLPQAFAHPHGASNQPPPYNGHKPQTDSWESDLKRPSGSGISSNLQPPPSEKILKVDQSPYPEYPGPGQYYYPGQFYGPPHQMIQGDQKNSENAPGPNQPFPGHYPYGYPWCPSYPPNLDPSQQYPTQDQMYQNPHLLQPNIEPQGQKQPNVDPQGQRQPNIDPQGPRQPTIDPQGPRSAQTPEVQQDIAVGPPSTPIQPTSDLNSSKSSVASATMSYEDEHITERVDQQQQSPTRTKTPEPEEDVQQPLKTIKVSKIPANASEDTVRFFFENKRKSGGGDIEDLDYDPENETAIITFEEEDVAERVISRAPLLLQNKAIDVEIFNPCPPSPVIVEGGPDNGMAEYGSMDIIIEVKGMKPTTSEDTIMYYFESRKGARADVEKIIYKEEDNMYLLWFKEESAIETVLSKTHMIDGQVLDVRRYIPPPPPKPVPKYDNKIFITGINQMTTKDGLENFLEAKAKAIPEEVIFGEEEGTALVTFEEPPDIEKLKSACMKRPLDKSYLQIHTVPITDCVVITGFPENISSDTLEYFFDNKRRSGVEGVRDVNLMEDEGKCLIYFDDPQSAFDVCKRSHKVEGQTLTVQVYYPCLGQPVLGDGPKFKPLQPVQIKDINPSKIRFLLASNTNLKALEKQLSHLYAEVDWPDIKNVNDSLQVRCVLTEDVSDWRKIGQSWARSVKHDVEKFLDMLAVNEVEILQEAWVEVLQQLRGINIQNPESVALQVMKDEYKVAIYGYKLPVDEVTDKVNKIVKEVTIELDRKKQNVTEEVSLKLFQILVLLYIHFIDTLKKELEGLHVHPKVKELKMVFTGMSGQVTTAKMKMYEQLNKVVEVNAGKFSDGFLGYLKTPEVKNYVIQEMKNKGIVGVWDEQEGSDLKMYSLSDEDAVKAVEVLKYSVNQVTIPLDDKQSALLSRPEWKQEVKALEGEYSNAILQIIDSDPKTVVFYQTSEADVGLIKEKVNDIFYKHVTQDMFIPLQSGESRLLQEQYDTELKILEENCNLKNVSMKLDNIRVTIQGSIEGTAYTKKEMETLIQSIHKKPHTINKPGIVKYMGSEQGKAKIAQVEKKNKVVVEVKHEGDKDDGDVSMPTSSSKTWTETAICTTPTGQTITTVVGDITELMVDVIVNAANKELQHVGGLAKVIVDKGGKSIQRECDDYVIKRNRSKMYEGEIFCSGTGHLPCKMIAHAVGPVWQGGRHREDEYLDECIQSSLEKCDEKRYRSIAIPALSTGVFGYPVQKATKVIVEGIKEYLKENREFTSVKDIYLCDLNVDTIENFVTALEKVYGKSDVHKQRGRGGQLTSPGKRYRHGSADQKSTLGPSVGPGTSSSHISVTLIKGQIASQEVDIIVNTTSTSLQLSQGAVSLSLLKLGGPVLQTECSKNYPGGIQPGEVATTSGGKLECKMVCHGALPGWNPGTATKIMETFMKNCLQVANDNGFVSIAFPALGTGNLGYPKQQVARGMFSCVDRFGSSNPRCSVCDVRFVVYDKDFSTIKAFEEEQRKRQSGEYTDRTSRRLESDDNSEEASSWQHEAMSGNKQASVDIGDLTLKIYQGDITEAEVDVIVNGTNRELDLTRGGVSQAILKKGGRELTKLLELPASKKQMKEEGMTITPTTNNFSCDYIVHVDLEDTKLDLKGKFRSILEAVDEYNKETVALPALGAGISYSMDKVAENLCEALISFQKRKEDVCEVHVVIFEQSKLTDFMVAMEKCLHSYKKQSDGIFSKVKGFFGYGTKSKSPIGHQWKVTKMQKSTLNMFVYAKEMRNAESAIRALEEGVKDDFREKVVEDTVIKDLNKDQKAKVLKLEEEYDVELELKERVGRIIIKGLIENISDALDEVHKIIKDVDRQKQKQQHARLVADMVQWYFISVEDTGQKLEEYPPEVNLILEQALKNNDQQAFFLDNSGNKYIVDFTTYEEFPEDDPSDTVAVLRKSKLTDSAFDIPSTWAPMDKNENIKIVPLQTTDKEYKDVISQFQTNMSGNYTNIIKVEKIQNRTLQQQYVAKKKHMDSTNAPGVQNEKTLWHGTAIDAVDSINTYGFNRSYCGKNAVAYGNGVYFAVNPSYSAQAQYARPDPNGNKRMYMCKVLVGEYAKGQGGMKVPPVKPGAAGGHILYDSVVDNPAAPGIFVIFHDTQAYPEYLIVFK